MGDFDFWTCPLALRLSIFHPGARVWLWSSLLWTKRVCLLCLTRPLPWRPSIFRPWAKEWLLSSLWTKIVWSEFVMSNLRPSIFFSWARARLWSSLILGEIVMFYSPTTLSTIGISSLGKTVIMVEFIWTKIVWGGFVMANSLTTLTIMAWATLSFELVHYFMTINMLSLVGRVIMVGFIMDETCLGWICHVYLSTTLWPSIFHPLATAWLRSNLLWKKLSLDETCLEHDTLYPYDLQYYVLLRLWSSFFLNI